MCRHDTAHRSQFVCSWTQIEEVFVTLLNQSLKCGSLVSDYLHRVFFFIAFNGDGSCLIHDTLARLNLAVIFYSLNSATFGWAVSIFIYRILRDCDQHFAGLERRSAGGRLLLLISQVQWDGTSHVRFISIVHFDYLLERVFIDHVLEAV